MFRHRYARTMLGGFTTTVALIYHQTVYNLRTSDRNAIVGLLRTLQRSVLFVAGFMVIFLIMGTRTAPLRGDFMIYMMTGIFIFLLNTGAVAAAAGASGIGGLTRHEPLNQAIMIISAGLALLYQQAIAIIVLFWIYHVAIKPIEIENPVGFIAMFLEAWLNGMCVGMVFLGLNPWLGSASSVPTALYRRVNMLASGKMFVANTLPTMILPFFIWNPLFHMIDQARGFVFINYTPLRTSPTYALWFSLAAFMIGLILNFTTRKHISLSWSAGS